LKYEGLYRLNYPIYLSRRGSLINNQDIAMFPWPEDCAALQVNTSTAGVHNEVAYITFRKFLLYVGLITKQFFTTTTLICRRSNSDLKRKNSIVLFMDFS
jgi:hypothetical protein